MQSLEKYLVQKGVHSKIKMYIELQHVSFATSYFMDLSYYTSIPHPVLYTLRVLTAHFRVLHVWQLEYAGKLTQNDDILAAAEKRSSVFLLLHLQGRCMTKKFTLQESAFREGVVFATVKRADSISTSKQGKQ